MKHSLSHNNLITWSSHSWGNRCNCLSSRTFLTLVFPSVLSSPELLYSPCSCHLGLSDSDTLKYYYGDLHWRMILIRDYMPPSLKLYSSLSSIGRLLRFSRYFSGLQTFDFVVSWIYHGPWVTHHGILHQRHSLMLVVDTILLVGVMIVEWVLRIRLQFCEL